MNIEISDECRHLIKLATTKLKGHERRAFMAEIAETLCYGSAQLTETEFSVGCKTVQLGMNEKRTGLTCYGKVDLRKSMG